MSEEEEEQNYLQLVTQKNGTAKKNPQSVLRRLLGEL
jgi:hypothetical protein